MGGRESAVSKPLAQGRTQRYGLLVIWGAIIAVGLFIFLQAVSYTHLTLPKNREV